MTAEEEEKKRRNNEGSRQTCIDCHNKQGNMLFEQQDNAPCFATPTSRVLISLIGFWISKMAK